MMFKLQERVNFSVWNELSHMMYKYWDIEL